MEEREKEKKEEERRQEEERRLEEEERDSGFVEPEEKIDVMIIGDSGVGKTAFSVRFCEDTFSGAFNTTVGIDFKAKDTTVDGRRVKLLCWDTAGQEKYRTLAAMHFLFRKIHGVILMYDIGNESSFRNVHKWLNDLEDRCDRNLVKVLVANKSDLPDCAKQVPSHHGKRLAKELDVPFFECSAATGLKVEDAFHEVLRRSLASHKEFVFRRRGSGLSSIAARGKYASSVIDLRHGRKLRTTKKNCC